ncbi:hypothetical protein ACTJJ0_31480 [Chitinophaga sp. 22321]|uniref:Secretin/TonB short N-terminal domain-containing protein n=1 Tax=Chitinophaga hostae TaxID=2831022 RepID=A0ABS5J9H9_9BACT|nr:hypothetical protein [Chitinophaga hostae]MBS0031883.1 hypothetical protein [Chitinophaga hostae]
MSSTGLKKIPYISVVADAINRTKYIIALLIPIVAVSVCSAQQNRVNLQQKIKLPAVPIRFDSLLSMVSRQTGARFSLNTSKYPPSRIIPISKGVMPVAQLLNTINERTGIYYTVLGGHIIFVDQPPRPNNVKTKVRATVKKQPVELVPKPLSMLPLGEVPPLPSIYLTYSAADTSFKDVVKQTPPDPLKKTDSTLLSKYTAPDTARRAGVFTGRLSRPSLHWGWGSRQEDTLEHNDLVFKWTDSAEHINAATTSQAAKAVTAKNTNAAQRSSIISGISTILQNTFSNRYQRPVALGSEGRRQQGPFSFLVNAGVSADEVYYANPAIQMGFPFLYGIGSWSTNFKVSGFRWGGGISARVAEDWRIHLQVTTGNQQQSYDTMDIPRMLKTQHLKVALLAERQLNERFRIQAGVVWNNLLIRYEGNAQLMPSTPQQMDEFYKELNLIRPPYTISNSYGEGRNTKAWLGFQLGVFYNINFYRRR